MVGIIAGVSVIAFIPSMVVAGVPADRWPAYVVSVLAAAVAIAISLLAVPARSWYASAAAVADALVIAGLGLIIGDHYHQLGLLFALVVAGHAVLHGFATAIVMVALGAVLVPLALTPGQIVNATDPFYAVVYLLGISLIIWRKRLMTRTNRAVRESEAKYRALVESVPAVVYVAEFGADGAWRYVSPQIEEMLGFPAEAWIAHPGLWWSRIHPDDRPLALSQEDKAAAIPDGQRVAVEYRMIARNGDVRWIRDEASVLRSHGGAPDAWNGFLTDITERMALEEQLKHQAFHDPLTGLANRVLFGDRVSHALARRRRRARSLAVLFLDLDDFKDVNDAIGHSAGDELLREVSRRLERCLRPGDTAARLGGDEFGILLEELADADEAEAVAARVLEALAVPMSISDTEILVSASVGIALSTSRGDRAEELLRNADVAMYAAKNRGKGRFELYEPEMHAAAFRRLELVAEMRQALQLGEIAVHYQPLVRLGDGAVVGYEALARWNHPRLGLVGPGEFIPAAEETGQIMEIGEIVLGTGCRQAQAWREMTAGPIAPSISVNVSARQFRAESLSDSVRTALTSSGLPPEALVLEVTESVLMDDSALSLRRLRELKRLGVRLAIDDFGTGYSSLSYLRRLPVDILKVDKSFIHEIEGGGEAFELVRMIVQMGNTLHLNVVAEGVETPAQAAALRQIGCDLAQGFHFARPMVAADVVELISSEAVALDRVG
jgi:diguanylate cyclase (GGDEF)-like protein/PAS domain S-box-containing protein